MGEFGFNGLVRTNRCASQEGGAKVRPEEIPVAPLVLSALLPIANKLIYSVRHRGQVSYLRRPSATRQSFNQRCQKLGAAVYGSRTADAGNSYPPQHSLRPRYHYSAPAFGRHRRYSVNA